MTRTCYIVRGSRGEYSDRVEWPVMATFDESLAKQRVIDATRAAADAFAKCRALEDSPEQKALDMLYEDSQREQEASGESSWEFKYHQQAEITELEARLARLVKEALVNPFDSLFCKDAQDAYRWYGVSGEIRYYLEEVSFEDTPEPKRILSYTQELLDV